MTLEEHNRQVDLASASLRDLQHAVESARQILHIAIERKSEYFRTAARPHGPCDIATAAQINTMRAERDDLREEVATLRQQLSGSNL